MTSTSSWRSSPARRPDCFAWRRWSWSLTQLLVAKSSCAPTRTSAASSGTRLQPSPVPSMRPDDRARLRHLAEAATKAVTYSADRQRGDLDRDELLRLACGAARRPRRSAGDVIHVVPGSQRTTGALRGRADGYSTPWVAAGWGEPFVTFAENQVNDRPGVQTQVATVAGGRDVRRRRSGSAPTHADRRGPAAAPRAAGAGPFRVRRRAGGPPLPGCAAAQCPQGAPDPVRPRDEERGAAPRGAGHRVRGHHRRAPSATAVTGARVTSCSPGSR